jgi:hypothetical protein
MNGCGPPAMEESSQSDAPLLPTIEDVIRLSPDTAVVIPHPDNESIFLLIGYVDQELSVTLLEEEQASFGIGLTADGKKEMYHRFSLEDGSWGHLVDSTGDGLPEERITFSPGRSTGRSEEIRYEFVVRSAGDDASEAEPGDAGNGVKPRREER